MRRAYGSMNEQWVFDFSTLTEAEITGWRTAAEAPINDVMGLLKQRIVDGPIEIDWSDRYGWTQLTPNQLTDLISQASAALWDVIRSMKGGVL
jgi:hypothetical protein